MEIASRYLVLVAEPVVDLSTPYVMVDSSLAGRTFYRDDEIVEKIEFPVWFFGILH